MADLVVAAKNTQILARTLVDDKSGNDAYHVTHKKEKGKVMTVHVIKAYSSTHF